MRTKHSKITAAELIANLKADPDFVARMKAKEQARLESVARILAEEEPLLAELRSVGCDVRTVWDLVNASSPYPEAIPILLKHLLLPYSDVIRNGIARALAVPEPKVVKAWSVLVEQYRLAPSGLGTVAPGDDIARELGAKDGLACALAVAVTEETLPELIAIAKDRTHGESRLLLLSALKKRRHKNSMVKQAIDELSNDPDLKKEISSWTG